MRNLTWASTAHIAIAIAAALAWSAPASAIDVEVSPPIRISSADSRPHYWWGIRASTADSRHLIACALRHSPESAQYSQAVLYGSDDGGKSWRILLADADGAYVSESECAFGRGQQIYFLASASLADTNVPQAIRSHRRDIEKMHLRQSEDFGRTWSERIEGPYVDNPYMVIEPAAQASSGSIVGIFFDGGKRTGRELLWSIDGGKEFASIALPPEFDREPQWNQLTGAAVRLPDGNFGALYWESGVREGDAPIQPPHLTISRVTTEGRPLGNPVLIARLSSSLVPALARFRSGGLSEEESFQHMRTPSMAVGRVPGSERQRVYVAWHDALAGRVRVLLSFSDDSGSSWSQPRVMDDLGATPPLERDTSAARPTIAVNAQGVLGVQWAEFQGRCWRFAFSRDGGATFESSTGINACTKVPPSARRISPFVHPYSQDDAQCSFPCLPLLVSDMVWFNYRFVAFRAAALTASPDGLFHAAWSAYDGALYSARIEIGAAADRRRRLSIELSPRAAGANSQLAPRVWLDYTHVDYDESTREFLVGVVLVKERSGSWNWPLVFQANRLDCRLGALQAVGADNGLTGTGAAWIFDGPSSQLPAGSRAAITSTMQDTVAADQFERSEPRTLRLRVMEDDSRKVWHPGGIGGLLRVEGEVRRPAVVMH